MKKNVILDATILSTLMSCARLTDFRFNHDLQQIGGKSSSLEMGSIVHCVLENYYKRMREGIIRDSAIGFALTAGELYMQGCPKCTNFAPDVCECNTPPDESCDDCKGTGYVTKPTCGHKPNEYPGVHNTSDEDIQIVWDTIHQYFEFYKNDFWIPIDVEYVKKALIYEDDEIRIIWAAKLDLTVDTNNGIYPVDHKTMKQRRDTLSLNNQFMGQCILMKTRGVIINKIGFQKTLKPAEKFTRPIISYTLDRLTEWSQIILPFWAKQLLAYDEIGFWPPNFTHCENKYGFCNFKPVCEVGSGMREETIRLNFVKGSKWDITND